mmetsp:Transcript_7368/g.6607  ORF Transcript_7368/g.6607 Transcript_7368/m.6607 type:complete len:95 (+) Transcript_7368:110-394(+)
MQAKKLTLEEAMKVHEAFRPLLLSKILRDCLEDITKHKKDRDEAQQARLQLALDILGTKSVPLPAYPGKTYTSLKEQMQKQKEKILKKKNKEKK